MRIGYLSFIREFVCRCYRRFMLLFFSMFDESFVPEILPGSMGALAVYMTMFPTDFVRWMVLILLPLQLPGWLGVYQTWRRLRLLAPGSLHLPRKVARVVALAYIGSILGVWLAACGFDLYTAALRPQFTAKIEDAASLLQILGITLWLPTAMIFAQLPGWLTLWWLHQPADRLPIFEDPAWDGWHQRIKPILWTGAAAYLIALVIYLGIAFYKLFRINQLHTDNPRSLRTR